MKSDYTFSELQAGIDSDSVTWGPKDTFPQRFEFPALCAMQRVLRRDPTRAALLAHFPNGFVARMKTKSYSTFELVSK